MACNRRRMMTRNRSRCPRRLRVDSCPFVSFFFAFLVGIFSWLPHKPLPTFCSCFVQRGRISGPFFLARPTQATLGLVILADRERYRSRFSAFKPLPAVPPSPISLLIPLPTAPVPPLVMVFVCRINHVFSAPAPQACATSSISAFTSSKCYSSIVSCPKWL